MSRAVLTVTAFVLVAGLFVLTHTGAGARGTCEELGAALPDGISLWPPGVRCTGGEPVVEVVRLNGTFVIATAALLFVMYAAAALVKRRPRADS